MLGGGFEETTDLAAAGKMLTQRPQHDDANVLVGIERLEGGAQLLTLPIAMTLSGGRSRITSARSRLVSIST